MYYNQTFENLQKRYLKDIEGKMIPYLQNKGNLNDNDFSSEAIGKWTLIKC